LDNGTAKAIGLGSVFILALVVIIYSIDAISSRVSNPIDSFTAAAFGIIVLALIGAIIINIVRKTSFQ